MEHPKVRFCQTAETPTEQKKIEARNNSTCGKGKVKVKSIVPIHFPIKVLENGKRVLIKDKQNLNIYKISGQKKVVEKCRSYNSNDTAELMNHISALPSNNVSEICDPMSKTESRKLSSTTGSKILLDENDIGNQYIWAEKDKRNNDLHKVQICAEKMQTMTIKDSIDKSHSSRQTQRRTNKYNKSISNQNSSSELPCILYDNSDEDSDIEVIQIINTYTNPKKVQTNIQECNTNSVPDSKLNISKTPQKENKENYSKHITNKVSNESPVFNKIKVLHETANAYYKIPLSVPIKKHIKPQKTLQLMPCAKFKMAFSTKNKLISNKPQAQVKKSSIFHAAGNQCKTSVQPGISHKKYTDICKDLQDSEKNITNNLLSCPEYNSMIGVMKTLKEIEKEKLVSDFEHLPQVYKNLVSEKVSAALDFSPYETVYKDLVDLSVDDDKLPARLMRSKDPEPRDKDIVPKLSDFYNPKYTEQYYIIVNPRPLNPINMNTLSAFTISNKICTWKICRDNF